MCGVTNLNCLMQQKPYTQVLTYLFQICKNKLTWLDISYMYNVITLWYILFSSVNAASIYCRNYYLSLPLELRSHCLSFNNSVTTTSKFRFLQPSWVTVCTPSVHIGKTRWRLSDQLVHVLFHSWCCSCQYCNQDGGLLIRCSMYFLHKWPSKAKWLLSLCVGKESKMAAL